MYDGADLSAVYGMPSYDMPMMQQAPPPTQPTQQPQQLAGNPHVAEPPRAPMQVETMTPAVVVQPSASTKKMYSNETFWDKIGQRKMEVIKMILLALVVVLGLSIDRAAGHYLDGYISKSILTNIQEFMVRISYPVVIILFIWIMKASM